MRFGSRSELQRGRQLRGHMTDAEVNLWMRLRGKQIGGNYFRRQVPMGAYIVDFVCVKAHLIIEVDGSQHLSAAKYMSSEPRGSHREATVFCGSGITMSFSSRTPS